jgi:hypothetical protein
MTQTDGLALLFAWLIFAAMLVTLAILLLRHRPDVFDEAGIPRRNGDASAREHPPPPGSSTCSAEDTRVRPQEL